MGTLFELQKVYCSDFGSGLDFLAFLDSLSFTFLCWLFFDAFLSFLFLLSVTSTLPVYFGLGLSFFFSISINYFLTVKKKNCVCLVFMKYCVFLNKSLILKKIQGNKWKLAGWTKSFRISSKGSTKFGWEGRESK